MSAAITVGILAVSTAWLDSQQRLAPRVAIDPDDIQLCRAETADRAAVEKTWQHYWDVYLALEAKYPSSQWTKLVGAIAVDPIRSQILVQAAKYRVEKIEAFGYVVTRPSWPQPIAGRTTAVMADCQDGTHAGSRYVTTGKHKTVGEARTSIRATFVMGRDHVWRVKQIAYLGTPC